MMKLMRNPELRQELFLLGGLSLAGALLCLFFSTICALIALGMGACALCTVLRFAKRRYLSMERMCQEIDRILHRQQDALIGESFEGELSILRSEVQKMTVRLREQADLLQADKVHLTEVIADIFHQLRTPLTSMKLTAEMLSSDQVSDEKRLRMARDLKRQLDRSQWLVESLLKLSKIDAGTAHFRQETVRVRSVIDEAALPLAVPMDLLGQRLIVEAKDECFTGDAQWTAEALGNLLKNCMEHAGEGGVIRVQAEENPLFTGITVQDSGKGFAKEDIPRLFERYYKGQSAGKDSIGIGLALARSIVTAQNGTIAAANAPEGGAVFTIRFYKSIV